MGDTHVSFMIDRITRSMAALSVLALDQWTKFQILDFFRLSDEPLSVFSWFHLVLVWNHGISFGLMQHDAPLAQMILLTITSLLAGGCGFWALWHRDRAQGMLWALVFGAACGNVLDRWRWGAVLDFIDWSCAGYHWPAFNVADSVLTVCGVVLCVQHLYSGNNPFTKKKKDCA